MRKTIALLILISAACVWLLGGLAVADPQSEEKVKAETPTAVEQAKAEDLSKLSGKELYKMFCKTCHGPDSAHGEYAPMTLIQEQWETFFAEDYLEIHKELADSTREGRKVIEIIDADMLKRIREFCHEGAADSEKPQTCG
jgi:cytochrome c5